MAAVRVYLTRLRQVHWRVGRAMGSDIRRAGKAARVNSYSLLAVVAVLCKLLVDKGVLSDADLEGAFAAAGGVAFDPEPVEPGSDAGGL